MHDFTRFQAFYYNKYCNTYYVILYSFQQHNDQKGHKK